MFHLRVVIGVDLSLKFCSILCHLFTFFGPKLQFKNFWDFRKCTFIQKSWRERLSQIPNTLFPYPALARPALPPCSVEIHPVALITAPLIHPSLHSLSFLIWNACALKLLWQTQLNYSSLLFELAWYFKALGLLRRQIWSPSSLSLASKAKEVKK